jgi:hypothetical protein
MRVMRVANAARVRAAGLMLVCGCLPRLCVARMIDATAARTAWADAARRSCHTIMSVSF